MKNKAVTILEECQIPNAIVSLFKRKGLVVPEKIEPTKEPLRSPSEEWFYSIADRFTPPLTEVEAEVFRTRPTLLSFQILRAVSLLVDLSGVLYEGLERVKENLVNEEAIAAILAILRIFHGCLDFNYLKYDRHLEYHEYKRSPVGYYWLALKEICAKVAKEKGVSNPDEWSSQKILEIIAGPRRMIVTSEYAMCCREIYDDLKLTIPDIHAISIEGIFDKIKRESGRLLQLITEYSEQFYRTPEEFIRDCIQAKDMNPYREVTNSKNRSIKAIEEIKSLLSEDEAHEFERVVEAVEDFLHVQELEGLIAYGTTPSMKNHLFDVLIEAYDQLKEILTANMEHVKPAYRQMIADLLKAQEVPSKFTADRKLVCEVEDIFDKKVLELYHGEVRRWKEG